MVGIEVIEVIEQEQECCQPLIVSLIGSGTTAQELAPLLAPALAHRSGQLRVWARNPESLGWVVDDGRDALSAAGFTQQEADDAVVGMDSAESALSGADAVILTLPFGSAVNGFVEEHRMAMAQSAVLDISNPIEITALGPKQAMYVPTGSAGTEIASRLDPNTAHVHALTHWDASLWCQAARTHAALPVVTSQPEDEPRTHQLLGLLEAVGWQPRRVGGLGSSPVIETGGAWALANARRAPLTWDQAVEHDLPGTAS